MKLEMARKYLERYESDTSIQNYIAQANSRYILYNASEPEENFPRYTEGLDERCLHIAFAYLDIGWSFINEGIKESAIVCMEKAANIFEHLYAYRECGKPYKDYYCLICALSYYVSSQYSKSFIVLNYYSGDTYLAKMVTMFLTRNFTALEKVINEIEFQEKQEISQEKMDSYVYTRILATALLEMLQYIYNGDVEQLINAKNVICDLVELAESNSEPNIWWVYKLLGLVFEEYREASLWTILPGIVDNDENCKKYIHANIYKKRPVVELFKSQRDCINESIKNNKGFVVGMPTSSGKTKIAEISIVKTLSDYPDGLCVYIAPFRSLANEIENSLSGVLGSMGYVVSNLYGSSQATQIDKEMTKLANIVIATPEKIKSIIRSNADLEDRIKIVIVDEGHLVGAQPRYITSELLIEEMKIILEKNSGKMVLLSAVLPNLGDFSNWISNSGENIAKSLWRPSAQRFGELIFLNNDVNLVWQGNPASFNNGFIERKTIGINQRTKQPKYFPKDKKEAVGATAVKMLSMGSVLIYVGRSNMVFSQARVVFSLFEKYHITHEWINGNNLKYVELACEEAYGKDSEMFLLIQRGIVCHSSKLPADVRQSVEKLMTNDLPKIIIATSTLGQGVNIGVSTVIVSNVYLDQYTKVDVKDFWNIAGRAGRAFTDTEGKILFAIDKSKNDYSITNQIADKNMYFHKSNIEKATSGLLLLLEAFWKIAHKIGIDYNTFLELLAENRDVEDADKVQSFFENADSYLDLIDDTLIAMDIKNNVQGLQDCCGWIDGKFINSLAYIQAEKESILTQTQVLEILKARNKGVVKLSGSVQKWFGIACSSMPLKASLYIDEHIHDIAVEIRSYIESKQEFSDLIELIFYLDSFIEGLPMDKDDRLIELVKDFPIRDKWYGGNSIKEIEELVDKAIDVCNQYYGFHFPWIINAVSKKLNIFGKEDESKVLEDISLFSEIGVCDIATAKVYLSGIRSRECSIEISKFMDFDSILVESAKRQLLNLLKLVDNGQVECSEKAYSWLKLLDFSNKNNQFVELSSQRVRLKYASTGMYDKLFVRYYNDDIYFCSFDYKIKLRIKNEYKHRYEKMLGIPGVYFNKSINDKWELVTDNPYVLILD